MFGGGRWGWRADYYPHGRYGACAVCVSLCDGNNMISMVCFVSLLLTKIISLRIIWRRALVVDMYYLVQPWKFRSWSGNILRWRGELRSIYYHWCTRGLSIATIIWGLLFNQSLGNIWWVKLLFPVNNSPALRSTTTQHANHCARQYTTLRHYPQHDMVS